MKYKNFKILVIIFLIGLSVISCGESKKEYKQDCSTTEDYKYGQKAGSSEAKNKAVGMDYSSTADEYLRNCNNGAGMVGEVSDCWREGFYAGYNN